MSSYTKAKNLEIAKEQVSNYPQYDGMFDNWIEVRVNKQIKTKMGTAFQKGELAIALPEIRKVCGFDNKIRNFMTVWSASNRIATSVEFCNLEILESPVTLTFVF